MLREGGLKAMDPLERILRLTEGSTLSNKLATGSVPREITFKVYAHWIPNKSQRQAVNRLSSLSRGWDNAQAKELGRSILLPFIRNPAATGGSSGFSGCGSYFY